MQSWGFKCTCSLCTASTDIRAESDVRRRRVDKILGGATAAAGSPEYKNKTEHIRAAMVELEEIARAEGLLAQLGDFWRILADACLKAGERGLAREVAGRALGLMRSYAGWDSLRAEGVRGVLKRAEREEEEAVAGRVGTQEGL